MADENKYALGLQYDMALTLTPLIPKDEQGKPSVNEKVYLDRVYVSYVDSGPLSVELENTRTGSTVDRAIRSDYGTPLGELPFGTTLGLDEVYTETGRRQVFARGRSEDVSVTLKTNNPLGTRIAAVAQYGTLIPQT